jgi:hypothetical protein
MPDAMGRINPKAPANSLIPMNATSPLEAPSPRPADLFSADSFYF